MRLAPFFFLLLAQPLTAHELWIMPKDFQPDATVHIEADLVNGQKFEGMRLPFLPGTNKTLAIVRDGKFTSVSNRIGNTPAIDQASLGDGLNVIVYQSVQAKVDYAELAKFESFVKHKDLGDAIARHRARDLPEANFSEVYTRYSKSLVGVGGGAGSDRDFGMETELVALANPYTDDMSGGLPVRLTYQGAPRADAQIELFDRGPAGVQITTVRTDGSGVARLPVKAGHVYMADAVVLREKEPQGEGGAVWETFWANLTFAVP
mgnify:FL=1|jgi:Domain of unknown function (DUF4198)